MAPALARWRQVRAQLDAGKPPEPDDATWLAGVLQAIVEDGVAPREALGLPARGGAGALHRVALLARRDALLRSIRAEYFASLDPCSAARAILALADQQRRARQPPKDPRGRAAAELLTYGDLPGLRQIANVLR